MKKLIALMMVLVLCLSLAACGSESRTEDDELLPFELSFGKNYDEVKEVCEALPELTPATANDGYITAFTDFEREDVEAYFADVFKGDSKKIYGDISEGVALACGYGFSFNENKELYELYLGLKFLDGETKGEYFFNHFCDFFDERFGVEAEINETDSSLTANYETETLGVSVMLQVEDYTFVYVILHDKTHELSE